MRQILQLCTPYGPFTAISLKHLLHKLDLDMSNQICICPDEYAFSANLTPRLAYKLTVADHLAAVAVVC